MDPRAVKVVSCTCAQMRAYAVTEAGPSTRRASFDATRPVHPNTSIDLRDAGGFRSVSPSDM